MTPKLIVGAGLSGLLAAHAWPGVTVIEAKADDAPENHRAVLRFRSDAVSRLTGIPFRQVLVRKSVWSLGVHCDVNIRLANLYARKVVGHVNGDRSIWSLQPVTRWVAPEDLYERALAPIRRRVFFGRPFVAADLEDACPVVSTIPMPAMLAMIAGAAGDAPEVWPLADFVRAPIQVHRYRIPGADAHQTVYFPDSDTAIYRASITGDLLTVESRYSDAYGRWSNEELNPVLRAFGLVFTELRPLDTTDQKYGKIVPISDATRHGILAQLTLRRGIYSLGRFATWRNVLLDDVVDDISVIKHLLLAHAAGGGSYSVLRTSAG